jgi:ankyrin repeat protein
MAKTPKWEDECIGAVVRGDADAMRRAVALGLPVNQHVLENAYTPLHYAVNERRTKPAVVAVLLEAGADVNARTAGALAPGRTPLMIAANRGRLDLVRQLLAAGADLHAKAPTGIAALAEACWGGKKAANEDVVRELLAAGAKPDAEALVAAGRYGSPEMVRLLIAAGATVNEVSRWGTALHFAVDEKRADTTEALLAVGADPTFRLPEGSQNWSRHYAGKSALDLARERKLKKLIPLLEAAAAGQRPAVNPRKSSGR